MAAVVFRIPSGSKFVVTGAYAVDPIEVDALAHLHDMAKRSKSKPKVLNSKGDLWEVRFRKSEDAILFALATSGFRKQFAPGH